MAHSIYDNKKVPEDFMGKWRSIEFELIFKNPDFVDQFIKFVKEKEYTKFITLKDDGSIDLNDDDNEGETSEVVVSFCSGKEQIVRDVCEFLKGKAYVNKSCGTHVHFDMRHVSIERVKVYGKRLTQCVPALKKLVPQSRRDNDFCGRETNSFDGYDDRYAFVNMQAYHRHKTIEIRGHSGTINASKILNWIKICEKIMRGATSKKKISQPEELASKFRFNKQLTEYVAIRQEQLNRGNND